MEREVTSMTPQAKGTRQRIAWLLVEMGRTPNYHRLRKMMERKKIQTSEIAERMGVWASGLSSFFHGRRASSYYRYRVSQAIKSLPSKNKLERGVLRGKKPKKLRQLYGWPANALKLKVRNMNLDKIENELASNPRAQGSELKGEKGYWRYRVGDFRVIYKIAEKEILILVLRVGHRKDIYKSI